VSGGLWPQADLMSDQEWCGMVRHDGREATSVFSGIDPDALRGTIDSVQRDQENLSDRASYYKRHLSHYGLGEEFRDVLRVAHWARDELPMLKRRYHLSMNIDNAPYPGFKGMAQIDEAWVTRAANEEAAKDAKRGVELAKKDPEDLTSEEFDELNTLLARNCNEYPFAERLVAALGPKKILQFWENMSRISDPPGYGTISKFQRAGDLDDMQKNLSLTIAQATNSDTPAMKRWKKEMVEIGDRPIRDPGPSPYGSSDPEGFIVMSSLMRYGDYDDKFLTDYGRGLVKADKEVLGKSTSPYSSPSWRRVVVNHVGNDEGSDPMTGYMKALSNSPAAATRFFTAEQKGGDGKLETNFKYLFEERKWPNDSVEGKKSVTGRNSMARALEAATTGHRPGEAATAEDAKHSKAQAALFEALVNSISADQDRLRNHAYMSDSLANISAEYMPDLLRGLDSDIANGSKLFPTAGVAASVDKYDAARFLHAVARNEEGYDTLNVSQHVYAAALMEQQVKHPNAYPESTKDTINKLSYGTGLFQGIIGKGRHFQADKDDAAASARDDAWKEYATTWGGSVVGSATGIATAPFTGHAGVVVGGLAGTAAGKVFEGILKGFEGDGGEGKKQVYKNVKEMDQTEHSVILTSQKAAKAASGSEEAESHAGDEAGRGFSHADDLVRNSRAE
jgi:hypothetical protein